MRAARLTDKSSRIAAKFWLNDTSVDPAVELTVFLMAGSVIAARKGQKTPDGYYNTGRMLKRMAMAKGQVLLCGTCLEARDMTAEGVMEGARPSTMDELVAATVSADKVLVF